MCLYVCVCVCVCCALRSRLSNTKDSHIRTHTQTQTQKHTHASMLEKLKLQLSSMRVCYDKTYAIGKEIEVMISKADSVIINNNNDMHGNNRGIITKT